MCLSPAVEQKVSEKSPQGTRKQQIAAVSWVSLHPEAPELCSPSVASSLIYFKDRVLYIPGCFDLGISNKLCNQE